MYEADDRLDGDIVWELFAQPTPAPGTESGRIGRWAVVVALIVVGGLFFPPMAVLIACLAVAWPDFRKGRQIARTLPDRAVGRVCARFYYAWGAWKIGCAAIAVMFLVIIAFGLIDEKDQPPSGFVVAGLLWVAGFTASSILAASGVWASYRSGMRVWIGEGVNQARILLLSMLIVGFVYGFILPLAFWLGSYVPRNETARLGIAVAFFLCLMSWIVGPIVILLVRDAIARRVIAETPSKFGKAVPAVGKWTAKPSGPISLPQEWPTD